MTSKQRILVIDDNPDIHQDFNKVFHPSTPSHEELDTLLQEVLGEPISAQERPQLDVELTFATQGEQGVRLAQAAFQEGSPFYLAFIDIPW